MNTSASTTPAVATPPSPIAAKLLAVAKMLLLPIIQDYLAR